MSSTKTTTPGSGTVKVSTNTGAAKDETFAGFNEDNVTQNFNVLANDPGSATLWSLDQNALSAPAGSQQPQNLNSFKLASGAVISVNADGTVRYDGSAALQWLAAGETYNDSFIYTIRMGKNNGALSTAKATVTVLGVNDAATFSGEKEGTLTEDAGATSGTLLVSDVDHDQSSMQASSQNGSFGTLAIDTAGNWTYTRTADMNYLQAGESVTETFTVKSFDGTAAEIVVTIAGANEPVVVTNPSIKWTVNNNNVTKQDGGLDARFVNGVAKITGFDGNDTLHTSHWNKDANFFQFVDTDADGSIDATLLNFIGTQGNNTVQVDLILVGYTGFTESQFNL